MTDPIFVVTMQDILSALSNRIDLSTISPEDLELAYQEVKAVFEDQFDPRPYIETALEIWEITRNL